MRQRERNRASSWRMRFKLRWQEWTRPSAAIHTEEAQRRSRLTSAILLILLMLTILHTLTQLSREAATMNVYTLLPTFLMPFILLVFYYLSRTRYSLWATLGVVTAVTAFPFILLFSRADYAPVRVYNTLIWLLVAIITGSVLLPFRQAMVQVTIILALIMSLHWLLPQLPFATLFVRPLIVLAVISVLLLTFRYFLLSLEKEQLEKERSLYTQLQTSEKQFRLLFEQAPIGMSISTPDGRFLHINQAYCDTVGYSPTELQGLSFIDITHPDDRASNIELKEQLLSGELSGFFMEKRYIHKDGHIVYALLQVVAERDADGRPTRIIGQITDITERKKTEEERRESQQLLQGLIENSTALIYVKDLDGRYLLVNTPFEKNIRLPRSEIIDRTDYDLFSPTIAEKLQQNDAMVLQSANAKQFEESPTENPESVTFLSVKFPLLNDAGQSYALAGISTDISKQKKIENLLRRQNAQLEALRQVGLEIAAQLEPTALLKSIIARAVEILDADKGALWLYEPDQDKLQLVANHNGILPLGVMLEKGEGMTGEVWVTGKPVIVNNYSHYSGHAQKFETIMAENSVIAVPVFWDNQVQGAISIAKNRPNAFKLADVDLLSLFAAQAAIAIENARLHESVRQHSLELARSNQDLQEFAYAASHDLQEPLRKIQTFGDRLQTNYANQLDERGLDYLQRMQQASARMQTLIVDLLAYSRVTTQARPFAPIDLNELLTAVLSDLEMRLEETKAAVQVDPLPTIDADATQMAQLFLNLLSNALKFTEPGRSPVIHIHSHPGDRNNAVIVINDNGIGFDEKYLDRIFGVFQRLHGRQEYSGTGVGLAICQKIVVRHNGRITATSTPGNGATFIITLPIHQSIRP